MTQDAKPFEDLNAQVRQTINQTKQQVLGAVDSYFNFLQKAVSSYPSGGTELGERLKNYAKKNIAATHEFLRKVSQAEDLQQILRIQAEFTQVK
jgi:Phasin protein